MSTKLIQLQHRVKQVEALADEVQDLAERHLKGEAVLTELSVKGQQWYRAARELLVQSQFSGLQELEHCNSHWVKLNGGQRQAFTDIERFIIFPLEDRSKEDHYRLFARLFAKARSLVLSVEQELLSRELPIVTQLSFAVAADEFDTAEALFHDGKADEAVLRASGVVAHVALERHLFTVADQRGLSIIVNPPTKKKADVSDALNTLVKANVVTPVQRSHLDSLFSVANNCAHPKEAIRPEDVERLITDGRRLASAIL